MADDYAARCRMPLREYAHWCWAEDGTYQVARLQVKWLIDDLALEQAMRDRETRDPPTFGPSGRIRWLGGGPCDPHDSCYFEDEGGAEGVA